MLPTPRPGDSADSVAQPLYAPIKRRSFFMYAGATAGATALALVGCSKESDPTTTSSSVTLGSGDVGVLNYAFALEQLEAAFYAQVVKTPPADFMPGELNYFTQIATHEAIHREFLRVVLTRDASSQTLQNLNPNFSSIDFTKRSAVLAAAKTFEDLGVAAYNGAGFYLKNATYLIVVGKLVSVEARHAALVRDLLVPGSFADDNQVDATTGLDKAMAPLAVIAAAQPFITEQLDATSVGK